MQLFFWDELLYLGALPVTKISILLFYLKIFPNREIRIACWVLISLNIGYFIAFELVSIFQCSPIEGAWRAWDKEFPAKCNNINMQGWMAAVFNIVLDLGTLVLPLRELIRLNLSVRKKVQIMAMFSVGFLYVLSSGFPCLVISLMPCQCYHRQCCSTALVGQLRYNPQCYAYVETPTNACMTLCTDMSSEDYVEVGYWSTIEVPVGIICACMPAIRSLFSQIFPKVFGSTQRSMPPYANLSNQSKPISNSQKTPSKAESQPAIRVKTEFSVRSSDHDNSSTVELTNMSYERHHSSQGRPTTPREPV